MKKKPKYEPSGSPWLYKIFGYQDPRTDYSHPFLSQTKSTLNSLEYAEYKVTGDYIGVKNYKEFSFKPALKFNHRPDYVIIELPNLLEQNYPSELMSNSDLTLMVCRSNRLWSKADENILQNIKALVRDKLQFILNGVEIKEVESLLGELPKKRSAIRIRLKNLFRFQFYVSNHI